MELKTLYNIKTKGRLYDLYDDMGRKLVSAEIVQIIQENRRINEDEAKAVSNLWFYETLQFIKKFGAPHGYILSEEIKLKIQDV